MQASRTAEEKGARKASQLAKMEEKYANASNKDREKKSFKKKLTNLRYAVATDPDAYQALYKKQAEKMKKEMAMDEQYGEDNHNYNSVDRYQKAINGVETMQNLFRSYGEGGASEGAWNSSMWKKTTKMREKVFGSLEQDQDLMNTRNAYKKRPVSSSFGNYLANKAPKKQFAQGVDDDDDEEYYSI